MPAINYVRTVLPKASCLWPHLHIILCQGRYQSFHATTTTSTHIIKSWLTVMHTAELMQNTMRAVLSNMGWWLLK